ncbi:MAG TPA: D-glycerate dehydrogenase [bacterium]|nr:D-glycerate dehydrogenase [bacterium]
MKKWVLITNDLPEAAFKTLSAKYHVTWNKKPLSEAQLVSRVKPYHALLSTLSDPISRKVLEAGINLRCVSNYAVGYNNIDLSAAQEHSIQVTNTPDVLTEATADIAWALILSCARRVPEGEKMVRAGRFKGWHPLLLLGQDLRGKTLGIYGFGRIGKAVARRGRGWNMKVLYHQRHRERPSEERAHRAQYVPFERLLRASDILSVNCPLTPETRHRFTSREFKKMKRTGIFINSARGPVHREADLARALSKKWIFSAGLDVYEHEPQIHPKLLRLKNAVLLPHLGSATVETRSQMAILAARNIDRVLSDKPPLTPVPKTTK